nr:HD domain-containing phosphohydrolase [Pontibacillus sp. HN14]
MLKDLNKEDQISSDVVVNDKLILKKGTQLSPHLLERLKKWGVLEVEVSSKVPHPYQNKGAADSTHPYYEKLFYESLAQVYSEERYGLSLHKEEMIHWVKELFITIMNESSATQLLLDLKEKDPYSYFHSFDVFVISTLFSNYLGSENTYDLAKSSLFHDLGKLEVPDSILLKEQKLTFKEYETIQEHTLNGERLLKGLDESILAQAMARTHHERLDGSGYPDGLTEKDLLPSSKLLSIVDVYSALTLDRVYRSAKPSIEAMEILLESPKQFDYELVYRYMNMMKIYPLNTTVLTSTNEIAQVTYISDQQPVTPIIQLEKNKEYKQIPHDLSLTIKEFVGWKEDYVKEREKSNWDLYMNSLLSADKRQAELQLNKIIDNMRIEDIFTEVFATSMKQIGDMYESGEVTIAEEHVATYMTKELMKMFSKDDQLEKSKSGKILLTTVGDEKHSLPLELFSETLELNGWETYHFHPSIPIEPLTEFVKANHISFVGFSVIMAKNIPHVESAIQYIKQKLPSIKILVGGPHIQHISPSMVDGFAESATEGLRIMNNLRFEIPTNA